MKVLGKTEPNRRGVFVLIVAMLVASAAAIAAAPAIMPDSYSWMVHSISESAGQNVPGAWLARTGFLLFGLAVLWLCGAARERRGGPAVARQRVKLGESISPLDVVAFFVSILVPPAMQLTSAYLGVLQRCMFLTAYSWYALEAFRAARPTVSSLSVSEVRSVS